MVLARGTGAKRSARRDSPELRPIGNHNADHASGETELEVANEPRSADCGLCHRCGILACSPGLSAAGAEPAIAKIVGLGATPCLQFEREASERPAVQGAYFVWVQGFMSGILISRPPEVDVGLDLNPRSFGLPRQIEFLREHCRQYPTQDVSDATVELYRRLRKEGGT